MMTKLCLRCGRQMIDSTFEPHLVTGPFCWTCCNLANLPELRPEEEPLPGYDHYRGRSDHGIENAAPREGASSASDQESAPQD